MPTDTSEEKDGVENNNFATIVVKIGLGKNHQGV